MEVLTTFSYTLFPYQYTYLRSLVIIHSRRRASFDRHNLYGMLHTMTIPICNKLYIYIGAETPIAIFLSYSDFS